MSDIYINTADTEYLLLSVMEGMACGLAVISFTAQEDAVTDGENGYVIRPSAEHMAQTILTIYKDGSLKKLKDSSRRIIEKYDWELVVEKIIREYQNLVCM